MRRPAVPLLRLAALCVAFAACAPSPRGGRPPSVPEPSAPAPTPPPPPPAEPAPVPAPVPGAPRARTAAAPPAPAVPREFRGVWVATVQNIDWPSRAGLSTEMQQAELLALLDSAKALNLNAIVFQVRPGADALYASRLEPWSEYLTGQMGRAPEPYWDPLAFAITEAHRRGLELHAWFNPYRARHAEARSTPSRDHVSRTKPHLVRRYGKYLWMDPGEPETAEWSLRVVMDVVTRYDVDGVHIDDYFYPYKEADRRGRMMDFPDARSYAAYRAAGGALSRGDWRRRNVDDFVRRMYAQVKTAKPWVKVGISPFGIWRPGYPSGSWGLDAYSELYADARKWLREGWVDYWTPQLYWQIAAPQQSYPMLLRWWADENVKRRNLWPGNYTSRVAIGRSPWPLSEVDSQISLTRAIAGASGNVHFSMKTFLLNQNGMNAALRRGAYAQPALVPASPWLARETPRAPAVNAHGAADGPVRLELVPDRRDQVGTWVLQVRRGEVWSTELLPGVYRQRTLAAGAPIDEVRVTLVDRVGREAPVVSVIPPSAAGGQR